MNKAAPILGITALVAILAFYCLDISLGEPMSLQCSVTGRYYVPPTTNVMPDGDGGVDVSTDPEEFHVTVLEVGSEEIRDLQTTSRWFNDLTNGEIVRVKASIGKWTHDIHILGFEE